MKSFDTNLVIHAANRDSAQHERARLFLEQTGQERDVVICELMLVEVFLKLCDARIFKKPMSATKAGAWCAALRGNQNWMLVEDAPIMEATWKWTHRRNFPFRRIIDIRLGLVLRHYGVTEFATANVKDFQGLGFSKVWNPLDSSG